MTDQIHDHGLVYNGVEKFPSPSDTVAIITSYAMHYSQVCGDAAVNKPTELLVV